MRPVDADMIKDALGTDIPLSTALIKEICHQLDCAPTISPQELENWTWNDEEYKWE